MKGESNEIIAKRDTNTKNRCKAYGKVACAIVFNVRISAFWCNARMVFLSIYTKSRVCLRLVWFSAGRASVRAREGSIVWFWMCMRWQRFDLVASARLRTVGHVCRGARCHTAAPLLLHLFKLPHARIHHHLFLLCSIEIRISIGRNWVWRGYAAPTQHTLPRCVLVFYTCNQSDTHTHSHQLPNNKPDRKQINEKSRKMPTQNAHFQHKKDRSCVENKCAHFALFMV